MALSDVLQRPPQSRQCCIKIVIGCLRCLRALHDRDLVQVNFSLEDLHLRNLDTVGDRNIYRIIKIFGLFSIVGSICHIHLAFFLDIL